MKKIIVEEEGEGLMSLLGEKVTLLCNAYFYTGILKGVNTDCVLLEEPSIVYETGAWDKKEYADAQKLPTDKLYIQIGHIESFGRLK